MAISFTLNGSYTLDESLGLQTGADNVVTNHEDDNDNDVAISSLPTTGRELL